MFSRSLISSAAFLMSVLVVPAMASTSQPRTGSAAGGAIPAALMPVVYQALEKHARVDYSIGDDGCSTIPQQRFKACFDKHGAHFQSAGTRLLTLHLAAWGRGSSLRPISEQRPTFSADQVTYAHGRLSEWWRVLPVGFEQGFTITKPVKGKGALTLVLSAGRSTSARNGSLAWGKLRYGNLAVTDANGDRVPARLSHRGNRVLISIQDKNARYPLTVDPLVWIEQQVTAGDNSFAANFGTGLAISGNLAIVGAPYAGFNNNTNQGAAYIFTRSKGAWTEAQELKESSGATDDFFGDSVAIDGTTILVGADGDTVNGAQYQGAVYVYTETNGTWSETQKVTAGDGIGGDYYGTPISASGNTVMIGAWSATINGKYSQGAVYVYNVSNGVLNLTQKLVASDGVANDNFGDTISLSNGTALIGAFGYNHLQGKAYLFSDSTGTWTQAQELTASDGAQGDRFGVSSALSPSTALIGASFATIGSNAAQGAAYIFTKSGGVWSQSQKLTASDGTANLHFGSDVALSGGNALIGAFGNSQTTGAGYLFTDGNGTWNQADKIQASGGMAGDSFGIDLAFDGSDALIGAPTFTIAGDNQRGSAFFYTAADLGLSDHTAATVVQGNTYSEQIVTTNSASTTSPPVALSIAVPVGTSFVSANASQGSCSLSSATVHCTIGQIPGNGGNESADVTLKASGTAGSTIDNVADVSLASPGLSTTSPTAITAQSSGGGGSSGGGNSGSGGGGGTGLPALLALALLAGFARRRR